MKLKLSFNKRTTIAFILIIIISLILYASLLTMVFKVNLQNEKIIQELRKKPGLNENTIKNIEEFNKKRPRGMIFPPLIIIHPNLIFKVVVILSGGVLFIILVATSGGFLFLRRTLHQIAYITENVEEIDEKKLHLRLDMKGNDAISKMSQTFDSMLDKLESSFDKQKQFIQNTSHELNTPLTVIKTNIDVLRQNQNASKTDYMEVLTLINDEINKLSGISDKLSGLKDNQTSKKNSN